jgi:carbonic anhydrase
MTSRSRTWLTLTLAAAVLGGGCKQWKAPEKVAELEKRVDELSDVVSEMKGKPVGKKKLPPKPKKEDDEDGEADEADEAGAEDGDGGAETKAVEGEGEGDEKDADDKKAGFGEKAAKKDEPKADRAKSEKDAPSKDARDSKDEKDAPSKDARDSRDSKDEKDAPPKIAEAEPASKDSIAVAAHKALASPAHWSYEGDTGPAHWGELGEAYDTCAAGREQSPIDVVPAGGKRASDIVFVYQPAKARVVDNGHTLQVNLDAGNTIFIDGHRYDLVQFHVHTPSEHTIAGERYPLELHLVHKDADGKLAVIAVLYDEGESSAVLDSIYRRWPSRANDEKTLGKVDPSKLLPDSRGVFRYEGSLTTPPCTEGVVWNVMRRTRTDSTAHLSLLKKHYAANARPVQPLRGRDVK